MTSCLWLISESLSRVSRGYSCQGLTLSSPGYRRNPQNWVSGELPHADICHYLVQTVLGRDFDWWPSSWPMSTVEASSWPLPCTAVNVALKKPKSSHIYIPMLSFPSLNVHFLSTSKEPGIRNEWYSHALLPSFPRDDYSPHGSCIKVRHFGDCNLGVSAGSMGGEGWKSA